MGVSGALAGRAVANFFLGRPYCASFELTHNCNARCGHCHRGDPVPGERRATAAELARICLDVKPVVAIMSGGEPLLREDLLEVVSAIKSSGAAPRVFLNTNAALLTPERYEACCRAGVDEVLVSLDFPDARHDEFRKIPGLFAHVEGLVKALPEARRRSTVLTTVVQSRNYREAPALARLAREWGTGVNFSAYTPLRTQDQGLMVPREETADLQRVVEDLLALKRAHGHVLTSEWVLRGMVRFFEGGRLPGCQAGRRMLVVNPDGTLSPCGLLVRDYRTREEMLARFTRTNTCAECYTSTRANSERPARHLFLDHVRYLRG